MDLSCKTVAIIGGGVSGIVQAKWLLQHQAQARILLFESRNDFGGVWDVSGSNGVMECTMCNVSRYLMELTDFPWPEGTIDFPHHSDVLNYIRSYAKEFVENTSVECHFNRKVKLVSKQQDSFVIETSNLQEPFETSTWIADYVIVANGHSSTPNFPFPVPKDLDFISHSASYKNHTLLGLQNKKVLVVGLSFSAVDIAVDLTRKGGNNVTVLTRRGSWFSPKRDKCNVPSDLKLPRLFTYLPHSVQNLLIKLSLNFKYFNQNHWQISNKCDPAGGNLVSSDDFVDLVRANKISVIHGSLEKVSHDKSVIISSKEGANLELVFDHVIFCTGYKPQFEFLSDDLNAGNELYPELYLNMIPLDHTLNLYYIGLCNVRYTSPFQVIDLQAQYIASLLTGKIALPDKTEMEKSVYNQKHHLATNCKAFRASLFISSDYRDNLARMIGKTPKLLDLLLSPRLFIEYYFGPITWAGYNISDSRLGKVARSSLNKTCDRAFGRNWFLKLNCIILGSVLSVTGAVLALSFYMM